MQTTADLSNDVHSQPIEKRHKIYICYHHGQDDSYKDKFIENIALVEKTFATRDDHFGNIAPDTTIKRTKALIRERFLRDSTVTVVLVGKESWKRRHTDWEISASITDTQLQGRSGLVGILLPNHPEFGNDKIDPFTIPPRLHDNIECGYAKLYQWVDDPLMLQQWIHEAFIRRQKLHPSNSRPEYKLNRIGGNNWKS